MKTRKMFWLFALTMMAVIFAACGGDAAQGGDGGDAGDAGDANASSAVELSQTETIEAAEFGGSISVSYPEGWVVQGEAGAIMVANSADTLAIEDPSAVDEIPAGSVMISMSVIPGEMAGAMGLTAESTPAEVIELFSSFMGGEGMPEFGDVEELEIDGNAAARATGSDDTMTATLYAVEKDGNFTFGFGATRPDEVDQFAETIQAVVASATFAAAE